MASRGSAAWRLAAWGPPCHATLVTVPIYPGGPRFQCDSRARDAFLQLGAVFLKHGYIVHTTGCYNCRQITGGSSMSSHAWGTAVDVNESTNPYRHDKVVTDFPAGVVNDVYRIRTASGVQVFRWGGDWDGHPETSNSNYDAMHFEIIATPIELAAGFLASAPNRGVSKTAVEYPVIRLGARGSAVLILQTLLGMTGTSGDGVFGPRTAEAVRIYQTSRGLVPDSVVGLATWTAILTRMPALAPGQVGPQKATLAAPGA